MTTQITTDNISPTTLEVLGSAVPKVSTIAYPGDDTAANPAGGDTITLTGTGFVAGATVIINGTSAGVVTVVSGTTLTFTAPASSPGTYVIYVINSDGGTAIVIPGISYSGLPNWSTSAGSLGNIYEVSNVNTTVVATGDVPITYSLYSGNLPAGSNINGSTGLISGTAPAAGSPTTYSFVIKATDNEQQDTNRSFSLTINPDTVAWINPANASVTTSYEYANISNVSLSANTESNTSVSFSQSGLPAGLSLTGNTISGSSNTVANTSVTLTATGNVAGRTATRTVYFDVQQDVVTWSSPANNTTYESFTNSAISNVSLSASSAGGQSITYTANTLPTGVSVSGSIISGTATDAANTTTLLTATSALSNRTATRTINWVISVANDTFFKNVTLLLNGETSVTPFISDASSNSLALTIAGDTKPVLFSPYQGDGYYSAYFDGTGDYLTVAANAAFALGTQDFCFECWYYPVSRINAYPRIAQSGLAAWTTGDNWALLDRHADASTKFSWACYNLGGNAQLLTSTTVVQNNVWYHIAVTRSGNTFRLFINGVQESTYSNAGSTTTSATVGFCIGGPGSGDAEGNGHVSNARFVKGTAVYTSNFTPSTTPLTAIANTSLLTCQSNRFIDNSTNNFTITKNGNSLISPNMPFTQNSSYSTYGSTYFDGTGDTLTIPSPTTGLSFGTGEFTIEMWVYKTSALNTALLDARSSASASPWVCSIDASNFPYFYDGTSYTSSVAVTLNTWTHIAVVKTSGVLKIFVNGVQGYSASYSVNLDRTAGLVIGDTVHAAAPYLGYISNLRIVKGTAVYTSAFTPPTTPLTAIANTSLLTLQYNGGATNKGIIDNSNFNNIITRNGNTSQGTFSPYSVTGWSNYFDGTGDYLSFPSISLDANFTIEMWIYPTAYPETYHQILSSGSANFQFVINNGIINLWNTLSHQTTLSLNTWHHIALIRSGTAVNIYVNGVKSTSTLTSSTTYTPIRIGSYAGVAEFFVGYISNLRIIKGSALYTASFTPSTTPLTAITNTSLLTCQSNRIIDNSPNSFTLTRNGDTSVQAFGPFGSVPEAVPISYSNYFDGTGDYLTVANNIALQLGSTYTVEVWCYLNSYSSNDRIISDGSTNAADLDLGVGSDGRVFYAGAIVYVGESYILPLSTWTHIAVVVNAGTLSIYINGVSKTLIGTTTGYNHTNSGTKYIGAYQGSSLFWRGYISNLRLVKGTAVYTSTFTPSTTPLTAIANTSLLTCQSTRMIDNSTNNFTITASGDTKPRIFNPFGYTAQSATSYTPTTHGGSVYLDGTGDYLTIPYASYYDIPASTAFTFECWVYTSSTNTFIIANRNWSYGGSGPTWAFSLNSGITPQWSIAGTGSATYVMAVSSIGGTINAWNHYAFTRDGSNVVRIFVNGVLGASRTDSQAMTSASGLVYIGAPTNLAAYSTGYISDIRLNNGVAIYTSNFVPPTTSLTAITNTSLLLNFNNGGIIDQHGSNVIETLGNAQLSTAVKKYNNSSLYFDGTGDYLYSPSNINYAMGSGDFTIELWYYPITHTNTDPALIGNYNVTWTTNKWTLHAPHASYANKYSLWVNNYAAGSAILVSTSSMTDGAWVHIAITRSGSTWKMFINGTVEATTTSSVALDGGTAASMDGLYVGANFYSGAGGRHINAYIDDLRITKGYARYTANFTAPTSALITK